MDLIRELLANPVAVTFVIISLGMLLGRITIAGLSLGASGVLFIALLFGHFRWADPDPLRVLGDFGVVLFVYAIGLQAGPRFLRTLRGHGKAFALVSGVTLLTAFAACVGAALLLDIGSEPNLTAGVFAGALTSTPGL